MSRLDEIALQIESKSLPPVHQWRPEVLGEIDIEIDSMGNWSHEGVVFKRQELAKLFSTILWSEDDSYFLVTPVEKLKIKVDDVPFVVQQAEKIENKWMVTTNVDDQVIIGEEYPVSVRNYSGQPIPYVKVRYDLWARVNRSVYYQWVEEALELVSDNDLEGAPCLWSGSYKIVLA